MSEEVVVEVGGGRLRGRRGEGYHEFLGIPYACAPRFAPPGPVPGWPGLRDATAPGPAAPQPEREVATFTHGARPPTDESGCLNLNVFTPGPGGSRPVLVWVHGGGFAIGHGGASIYHGGYLARTADLVVVTLNYRLGSLGWLWHPELAAEPGAPAGNWGLLDQIAALEWVRRSIAAFGGDPARVTLAGQSAGALSAMDMLVSPPAQGLFGRLILQSPPLVDVAHPPELAVRWAAALHGAAGGRGAFHRQRLASVAADDLVALSEALLDTDEWRGTRGGALPTLDPIVLPISPVQAAAASGGVEVLVGSTADEGTFFFGSPWRPAPPPDRIRAIVAHLCHTDDPDAVLAEYGERNRIGARVADAAGLLAQIATDAMFTAPIDRWATARAAAAGRVFRYRFDHPGAGAQLRATHTAEVPLLFGTWRDGGPGERLGGQAVDAEAVSAELVGAWAGFIHRGEPGWHPLDPGGDGEPRVFGAAQTRAAASREHAD